MRVAIIHYWLVGMRGGEKVLEEIASLYPQADIFTHVANPARLSSGLADRTIHETFIARLPFARRAYKAYLGLMPRALEGLDLSGYDLVLSSESGPAKGVIAPPNARHLCYCHSPMRYVWDQFADYSRGLNPVARAYFCCAGLFLPGGSSRPALGCDRSAAGRPLSCELSLHRRAGSAQLWPSGGGAVPTDRPGPFSARAGG